MRYLVILLGLVMSNLSHGLPRCVDIVSTEEGKNYFFDCDIFRDNFDYSQYDERSKEMLWMLKNHIVPAIWHQVYNGTKEVIHIMVRGENGNSVRVIHCCEHIDSEELISNYYTRWESVYHKFSNLFKKAKRIFF